MHAKERMVQRDISRTQIFRVLQSLSSVMTKAPCQGMAGGWKCEVEGFSAGVHITVILAIELPPEPGDVFIITVY
jgi:hypothetical protein